MNSQTRITLLLASLLLLILLGAVHVPGIQATGVVEPWQTETTLIPLEAINRARSAAGLAPIDPNNPPDSVQVVNGDQVVLSFEPPVPSHPIGVDQGLLPQAAPGSLRDASGNLLTPTSPLGGFQGVDFDDNATYNSGRLSIPPDPIAAAGPNHLVSVVNTMVAWYNKNGSSPSIQGLRTFFSSLNPLTYTFDPKVIYDQHNGRFLVVTLEKTSAPSETSRIFLAVSDDSNPNGTWYFQQINSLINIGGFNSWADYPGFAVDHNAIYITANMFDFSNVYRGLRLWIIGKSGLYGGGTSTVNVYDLATAGGFGYTAQPAHTFGVLPGNTGTYIVQSRITIGNDEYVGVYRVDNPLGTPSITYQPVALGDIGIFSITLPDAPQSGTATLIEVNDSRALNAVWRNNSLYLSTTIESTTPPNAGQTSAYWIELDTTTPAAITVNQLGEIGGEDIAPGTYTFFPSVMVDNAGNVGIGFSASAPTIFAGAYATRHHVNDLPGTVRNSETVFAGTDYYIRTFGGSRNRWGDYSGMALDPSDGTFWAYNEYAMTRGTPTNPPLEYGRWATAFLNFSVLDYGDAPDPTYPTLLASNGARHIMDGLTFLGAGVDEDPDGQPNASATGDDSDGNDDENGVTFTSTLYPGGTSSVDAVASAPGLLNAWIDFNGNGSWADPGEQIFTNQALVAGLNSLVINISPTAGAPLTTFARFRFSTAGGLTFVGLAQDGEVEDYQVLIEEPPELDFGDAPDPTYPTLLASNGARHILLPGLWLGAGVDSEPDGQPDASATGDDNNGTDDEDGVVFTSLLVACEPATVDVAASLPGLLNAWIDFNGNGTWADPGEQIFTNQALAAGLNNLIFTVPCTAIPTSLTFARFRFDSAGGLSYDGLASDGEVEDHALEVYGLDFGDAPDPSYPTLLANNGARHIPGTGPWLGTSVDTEPGGQPTAGADGDDNNGVDDEDGVTFPAALQPAYTATVTVTATASGLLNAWVDFNADGDWADASEQIFIDALLSAGSNLLNFDVPYTAVPGTAYARFRFDSSGGLSYDGLALDGEVEDHPVQIAQPEADFGDAPDPRYPTLQASNGARHILNLGPWLGASVDLDPDGQPTAAADGDDSNGVDDEDGVTFTTALVFSQTAGISVTAAGPGVLNAWIDFNADGDWVDPREQILTDTPLISGTTALTFTVPITTVNGDSYARFRFDSGGGLSYSGIALNGEVEDYRVTFTGVGSRPVAAGDVYTTTKNVTLSVAAPGVLGNDSDADGDALTAVLETLPITGSLTLNPDGSFIYTPTIGFSGVISFTYHASDSLFDSDSTAVVITVTDEGPPVIYLPLISRKSTPFTALTPPTTFALRPR